MTGYGAYDGTTITKLPDTLRKLADYYKEQISVLDELINGRRTKFDDFISSSLKIKEEIFGYSKGNVKTISYYQGDGIGENWKKDGNLKVMPINVDEGYELEYRIVKFCERLNGFREKGVEIGGYNAQKKSDIKVWQGAELLQDLGNDLYLGIKNLRIINDGFIAMRYGG